MLNSITISNFKAITEPLTLNNLGQVNYLVGKNGCGKSSVLDALSRRFSQMNKHLDEIINKVDCEFKTPDYNTNPSTSHKFNNYDYTVVKYFYQDDSFLPSRVMQRNINHQNAGSWSFGDELEKLDTVEHFNFRMFDFEKLWQDDLSVDSIQLIDKLNRIGFFIKKIKSIIRRTKIQGSKEKKENIIEITFEDKSKTTFDKEAGGFQFLFKLLNLINRVLIDCKKYKESQNLHYGIDKFDLIICIEEPENTLHPHFQKYLPLIFNEFSSDSIQFIISTHSNYLISEALSLKYSDQKVYHFDDVGVVTNPEGISSLEINSFNNVLDTLGAKPSDMLFANGIIWIEGPSDAVYIKYWLGLEGIEQGRDYEFSFYGGRILSNCETENGNKIMKMLKINTKAILYMDSDKSNEGDKLNETKTRIINEFKNYTDSDIWVSSGREIENYLSEEMLKSYCESLYKNKKKKYKIIDKKQVNIIDFKLEYGHWNNIWNIEIDLETNHNLNEELNKMDLAEFITKQKYSLSKFSNSLESQIKKYSEIIRKWNN